MKIEDLNVDKILNKPYLYIFKGIKLKHHSKTYILLDINCTTNELVLFSINEGSLSTLDMKTELITSVYRFVARYFEQASNDRLLSKISTNIDSTIEK